MLFRSKKWDEEEIDKWNMSLYINRMMEGETALLEYPGNQPEKNRFVVLTDAGLDHLENMSL